ncbi:MAG: putative oxidoreductase [Alphaproteobacteria bacterium]|nr:putative oxidoreductase [Alphaproteobacteria bacterium]
MSNIPPEVTMHRDSRPLIDRVAASTGNVLLVVGRILIGGLYVWSGYAKLTDIGGFAAMLGASGLPLASLLAPIAAALEFGAGVAIVLGLGTRYAALALIAFTAAAALIAHRFWQSPPDQQLNQTIHFAKNVAIIGGFVFVFVTGGGHLSLDRLMRGHR